MMERTSVVSRNTKETEIQISLNLDGSGKADIQTGIGFFDHMLNSFARHGFFDLTVKVKGDLEVDTHHTIEDTGIVLGQAIKQAVGDKKGIVMAPRSFPWTNPWSCAPWIYAAGRIWSMIWTWTVKR